MQATRSTMCFVKAPRMASTLRHMTILPRRTLQAPGRSGTGRQRVVVRAGVDPLDRALGSAPYLLPLLDGLKYGTYLCNAYPVFQRILTPLFPLYDLYRSLPFGSVIVFFALYFGVVRNQRMSRFVRFNAMQAVLIDILIILPDVLINVLRMSSDFRVPVYNVTWMYVFCCTVIGIGCCIAGQSARLPLVANASDVQVDR